MNNERTDVRDPIGNGRSDISLSDTETLSIRAPLQSYLSCLLLTTFFSAFLFYLGFEIAGTVVFLASCVALSCFAVSDHICFDGRSLRRTGAIPRWWAWFDRSRKRLKISDIEQVETHASRALKRGSRIYYRYRTVVRGKGMTFTLASGGDDYRFLIKRVLNDLIDDVLDNRSLELRDHLSDPKEVLMKAEFARIPAADVLQNSFRSSRPREMHARTRISQLPEFEEEKADDLRTLGNELRLSGYLVQALEAFRRALVLRPRDARLLFDFARCLHSYAGVEKNKRLERKALAALRLTERRGSDDGELLNRLGEWYFQIGEWRRAGNVFHATVARIGENFRTARGLAEIALREGKIAHVIHQFSIANLAAVTPALRRWTKNETDYFTGLQSDDEYLELEIARVQMLETCEGLKKTTLRIALFAFPLIFVGLLFEDALIANLGWAISIIALIIWGGSILGCHLLGQRIPHEMIETD